MGTIDLQILHAPDTPDKDSTIQVEQDSHSHSHNIQSSMPSAYVRSVKDSTSPKAKMNSALGRFPSMKGEPHSSMHQAQHPAHSANTTSAPAFCLQLSTTYTASAQQIPTSANRYMLPLLPCILIPRIRKGLGDPSFYTSQASA